MSPGARAELADILANVELAEEAADAFQGHALDEMRGESKNPIDYSIAYALLSVRSQLEANMHSSLAVAATAAKQRAVPSELELAFGRMVVEMSAGKGGAR